MRDRIFNPAYDYDFTAQTLDDKFPDAAARVCTCASAVMCCVAAQFSDLAADGGDAQGAAEGPLPPAGEEAFTDVVDELGDVGASAALCCRVWVLLAHQ